MTDLHVVAAEVAGRIVAGDASVAAKLTVGASNGGAIGGGDRFTVDDLGNRWEGLAERVYGWLLAHRQSPASGQYPTARELLDGPPGLQRDYSGGIRNPYEQP